MSIEDKLAEMGLALPEPAAPLASYVPAVQTGNYVFTSGQLPTRAGKLEKTGRVGLDLSTDDGYAQSQIAVLNALAAIKAVVGTLDRVVRVVRVTGYVCSADAFEDQPAVVNGASDLLLQIFGEAGKHSRAAVGVYMLPRNAPVEIDLVVEIGG